MCFIICYNNAIRCNKQITINYLHFIISYKIFKNYFRRRKNTENKKIVKFIEALKEKGYINTNSNINIENTIKKISYLEDKLTDEEFEELQKLFFIVIENIKDEYFELGMIAGKVMQDE